MHFSRRELEVLKCLVEGLSPAEIADQVGFSCRTTRRIRRQLQEKLGTSSDAQTAVAAVELGLVEAKQ